MQLQIGVIWFSFEKGTNIPLCACPFPCRKAFIGLRNHLLASFKLSPGFREISIRMNNSHRCNEKNCNAHNDYYWIFGLNHIPIIKKRNECAVFN